MGAGASSSHVSEYEKVTGKALTEDQKARIAEFNQAGAVSFFHESLENLKSP